MTTASARQDRGAGQAVRRGDASRARDPRGDRYALRGAIDPGRARFRSSANLSIGVAAVEDPHPDPTRPPLTPAPRVLVTTNRRVDILEDERSHGRIKTSEYEVGRVVQAVFERASGARLGSGGWNQGDRVDQATAHELAVIYAIEDTRTILALTARIQRALGPIDARLLRQVLGDRMTFADVAASRGRAGDRGKRYYADRFRDALEQLDQAFAARGRRRMVQEEEDGEVLPEIRTERMGGSEDTDVNGVVVPAGKGYRLVEDPAGRWVPAAKRKQMSTEAEAAPE